MLIVIVIIVVGCKDLDSFLAGGRKMAVQAAKVIEDKKKLVIDQVGRNVEASGRQASQENLQKSAWGSPQAIKAIELLAHPFYL